MVQPIPYLAFDGTCGEAMRFYQKVLGGKLGVMTNRQSPFAERCPPDHLDRVCHASLELDDGGYLFAGDCPPGMAYQGIHGISITLNFGSVEKAAKVFDALAEGGTVTMPFAEAFWARRCGMIKDRYGCHWIVNGEMIDVSLAA
jgi:PhnB protein